MRTLLRLIGLVGGIGLLVYGLLPSDLWPYPQPRFEGGRWMALLWAGVLLLGLGIWAALPAVRSPSTRVNVRPGLLNLSLAFSLLFVALTIQLLRNEFIYAASIYNRTEPNPQTGTVISNSRPLIRSLRTQRGAIVDRNNVMLAGSRVAANGIAQRIYPIAQQADIRAFSNLLGYASATYGLSGLEAQWNGYLSGEQGQALRSLADDIYNRPHVGGNMQLTIDAQLQHRVWQLLNQHAEGRPGSVIVMDPRSGAVLAMTSTPGFDPQSLALNPDNSDAAEQQRITQAWEQINADENRPLINRPLQAQYVPGSTFKTLTAIGALEHPEVQRQPQPIDCPNEYRPDPNAPPVVNAVGPPNHPDQPPLEAIIREQAGTVDLSSVYAFSCNTAFAQLGVRLGQERFIELAERFHIFLPQHAPARSPDFTDLPTAPSLLSVDPEFLSRDLALADTAFGQGQLLITPLQMALLGATIANDGVMPQPYLVEAITDPHDPAVVLYQHRQPFNLLNQRRLISAQVAATMRQMMRAGVTIGFGKAANVNNSGGKSGSGEAGNGIVHAAFLAIAPVDEPRYVVYVQVENGRDGAGLGARLAGDVLRAAFEILG
ncbi:penicillin-binding transpeptidase domain-containing protein [Kallotenue papyrolyticum]|uniref:penicillin-binding transpeptidase domain-containing protein n=1 Tax=Kallotenue papyrolyticum TaxID=1325125 RepID=UPI0005B81C34|nr:penicillin-binding transpeptidase domain-containing protein [Kallotenue papyrolyticum]